MVTDQFSVDRRTAMKTLGAATVGGLAYSGRPATALAVETTASANPRMRLRLAGIEGDADEAGAIDVLGWQWAGRNDGTMHRARGGAGRSTFDDFRVLKRTDVTSPVLWISLASGRHIRDATLIIESGEGSEPTRLAFEFEDVLVTGIDVDGVEDPEGREVISLNFRTFEIAYTPQEADGSAGETVRAGWDIAENTAT